MMFGMMLLGEAIDAVSRIVLPIDMVLILPDVVTNSIKPHIHGFGSYFFTDSFGILPTVLLSVTIGVEGYLWPKSLRVMQSGTPPFLF
jgi:hypothetical protein